MLSSPLELKRGEFQTTLRHRFGLAVLPLNDPTVQCGCGAFLCCTDSEEKRRTYSWSASSGYPLVPSSVESYGCADKRAVACLGTLGAEAVALGDVGKSALLQWRWRNFM